MTCLAPLFLAGCATTPSDEAVARGLLIRCEASSLRSPPSDAEALRRVALANAALKWANVSATEFWLTASDDSVVLCLVDDEGVVNEWWKFAPGSDRIVAQDAAMIIIHPRRR